MKRLKKMMALVIAMVMVVAMTSMAFAAVNDHVITITNTDQNVAHTFEAYKVFSGNLDAAEEKLSDIAWADGVNGTALQAALVSTTDTSLLATAADLKDGQGAMAGKKVDALGKELAVGESLFKNCTSAQDVAKVLATFASTNTTDTTSAGRIDAAATIIAANLGTKTANFTADASDATKYTASVTGDGYYFIKDTTSTLTATDGTGSDTKSKYLLSVIKDTTIVAKDTGIKPKKEINDGTTKVAADSSAIGDKVNFEVTVEVPNTAKYEDHFVFHMNDKLPEGLTFFGLTSIDINGTALPAANYTLTATTGEDAFTVPATQAAAVTTTGGQAIKIVFNDFKSYVETNNLIGKTITIKYSAVVNEKAKFGATGNENEVKFDYSNDPNHDYTGDSFNNTDPKGTTTESKTKTYVTTLEITKTDSKNAVLEGATFKLEGTALNHVLVTGEKFEATGYTAQDGETIETGTYYKLKDGSYTTTVPGGNVNTTQYESTTQTYVKVSYSKDVVDTSTVTLTGTSDKNGIIKFEGLNEGEYTLTETIAPDGFNLLTDPLTIDIDWTDPTATGASAAIVAAGGFSNGTNSSAGVTMDADGAKYKITVVNNEGTQLPSTGGIGTTIFYVVGALLVIGAGVVLVTRRRMDA